MEPSSLTEPAPSKPETKSSDFFGSVLDAVLSVPESAMDNLTKLAMNSAEIIDGWVSGAAKAVANVFIPDSNSNSQPAKE